MSYDYSENTLVQESAGHLLEELGWEVKLAYNYEILGKGGTFGRESYREILLSRYFREALKRLNPWINEKQIGEARETLTRHLSTASLLEVNEEKYFLIRDGIPVTIEKPHGEREMKRAMVIDFSRPERNHFLAVKEMKIHGELYHRRTDIVGFVNGIPLLFVELKRYDVDVRNAYDDNYTDYLDTIPQLFYFNGFLMLSNGREAKVGTLGSPYAFFHEWKRLSEEETGSVALETMLRGICRKENFLDLFENFILYDHSGGHTAKILARNHQYLGVNEAVKAYESRRLRDGKLGVFWHTQGSGKSYSMVFFAKKIKRKMGGHPTFVVLTDREELNRQISDTFENCGLLDHGKASSFIASSSSDLEQKLLGNPSFIFTLIQKFNADRAPIYPDHDVIIMSDEAHRSQNGIFADHMMKMLPTASRIGFTGTPLLSSDELTKRTFGGYVSIYDFQRAIADGATVPLYYENRGQKIGTLRDSAITEEIQDAIERADLDVNQAEKVEQEFAKEIHLLTAEPRLRAVARDFAENYSDLWTSGKAMVVCLNKVTCVRMYDYVQTYWKEEIRKLTEKKKSVSQQEAQELSRRISWMEETEMAVVVSQEQNEIRTFQKWGLDIKTHREKMEKRELDKEFKDPKNPLRVVFVCAMWLTGFDVKCLSALYLDKPLKAHTLMQTIARANRVSEGKSNGLILDYIGILNPLKKALADYTADRNGGDGALPTVDKEKLIERILAVIGKEKDFLKENHFHLTQLVDAVDFEKLELLERAANVVCESLEKKKTFTTYAAELDRLMKYTDRDDVTSAARKDYEAISAIYRMLRKERKHTDTTDLAVEINEIVSRYVEMKSPGLVREGEKRKSKPIDISAINFALLQKEFARSKKKNLLMRDLEEAICQKIHSMMLNNPGRINFYEKYQEIIERYNAEQDRTTIEKTFQDLLALSEKMTEEAQRYVREGFTSDEELSLYDILLQKDRVLEKEDIKALKAVASTLLQKIKAKIAELDHWTDKEETRADVKNLIRDTLWNGLPLCYDDESILLYRQKVYEYVYQRYKPVA